MKIYVKKYNIEAEFIPHPSNIHTVRFFYNQEYIEITFGLRVTDHNKDNLPLFAIMAVESYIEKN